MKQESEGKFQSRESNSQMLMEFREDEESSKIVSFSSETGKINHQRRMEEYQKILSSSKFSDEELLEM